jgi:peptide maturation system protein (TIGR04066 family)
MDKKVKAVVYPFDRRFSPILRHRGFLQNFNIVGLVSPSGWGLDAQDAGRADGGSDTGISVHHDFDELLNACDTVIFTESFNPLDFTKIIRPKINRAVESGKNIICTIGLEDETRGQIAAACEQAGVAFGYFDSVKELSGYPGISAGNQRLFEIKTPVFLVLGVVEETHKFEMQLSLRENLLKMDYRISQVGSRNYCELLGFHSFPGFMYNRCLSEVDKIILFNHYLKKIELEEKPDLMIIGVPGGSMRIDNEFTNHFGIMAYEVSQAVTPDVAVFGCLYEEYKPEFFEMMATSAKYKFGFEVDCFNLANIKLDWESSKAEKMMLYTTLDAKFIDEKKLKFSALKTPVYNVLNAGDAESMTHYLVNKLAGYAETSSI